MERTRGARCAVVLGGVVAAATLSVTVWQPASAAPQTDMTWSGTDAAQATTLPAGLKEAVRRDLGISPREYVERPHDARAVSAEAQRLREDDPGAFGTAWLRQDGTPTIAVTAAAAAQEVHSGGADRLAIAGVMSPAVVGTPVCKSGATSGYTCGEVLAVDETVPVQDAQGAVIGRVRGFITSVCTLSGDSGGPMFSGTAALGIVSASDFDDAQGCGISPAGDGGPMTIGVPVRKILDAVNAGPGANLTLRTVANPGPPIPAGDGGGDGVPGVPKGSLASLGAS